MKIDNLGSAEVWRGQFEQAELYHQELVQKGLTMTTIKKKDRHNIYYITLFF